MAKMDKLDLYKEHKADYVANWDNGVDSLPARHWPRAAVTSHSLNFRPNRHAGWYV